MLVKEIKDKEETLEDREFGIKTADKEIDEKFEFSESIDDVTNTRKKLKQFFIKSNLLKFEIVKEAVEIFDKFFKGATKIQRERVEAIDVPTESTIYERGLGD